MNIPIHPGPFLKSIIHSFTHSSPHLSLIQIHQPHHSPLQRLPIPILLTREHSAPNLHPSPLLPRQLQPRFAKRLGHDEPDLRAQDLDREKGFPAVDGEADAVAVDDEDAGVHLRKSKLWSVFGGVGGGEVDRWMGFFLAGTYFELGIATC